MGLGLGNGLGNTSALRHERQHSIEQSCPSSSSFPPFQLSKQFHVAFQTGSEREVPADRSRRLVGKVQTSCVQGRRSTIGKVRTLVTILSAFEFNEMGRK